MSSTPKKLRNGPTIAVDDQILRWRQRLKRQQIKLGRGMKAAAKDAERMRKERATDTPEKLVKKKWFG